MSPSSSEATTFTRPFTPRHPPSAKSRWTICDIAAELSRQAYDELEARLTAAHAASLDSREGEQRYTDALPGDLSNCLSAGPEGLALLRAWQAALPGSGHAHLCEAHYWFHWAYEYRGGGWASSVSADMWTCAHAAVHNMAAAALQALTRDPRLWGATALMMQGVAAFNEPDWLTELVQRGVVPPEPIGYGLEEQAAADEDLVRELARSGMSPSDRIRIVAARPEALRPAMQGKKLLKGVHYWMWATLHIDPGPFYVLKNYVWFLQPRWGGSHDRIRAFIASPCCEHLSEVEKDRLGHEIWRDDYLNSTADENDDPQDVAAWMEDTRRRAAQALWPYHRYEALMWLAQSHHQLQQADQAFASLRQAEAQHPFDSDYAVRLALRLACTLEPDSDWLAQAVRRSAESDEDESTAARILYGYFACEGLQGFSADPAIGQGWLDSVDPRSLEWSRLACTFRDVGRLADFHRLLQLGHQRGAPECLFYLGYSHAEGLHVPQDRRQALKYYAEAVQEGSSTAAYNAALIHHDLAAAAATPALRAEHEALAIDTMLKAHQLGDEDALERTFRYIADSRTPALRRQHRPWVRQHAEQGHATAMAALSRLLADPSDPASFNYRDSVRWLMGAQAIDPGLSYLQTVLEACHKGLFKTMRYEFTRSRIGSHEIPGPDNAMV